MFRQTEHKEKKYAKKTASSAFTTGDTYYVEAYDISSSKVAGLFGTLRK